DSAGGSVAEVPLVLYRTPSPIQETLAPAPVDLWWMEGLRARPAPPITRPIEGPRFSFSTSATELRMRRLDPEAWTLRYGHGVVPGPEFALQPDSAARLPARIRGTLIHTVLERLEAESELARILGEAIAGLDAPESEILLEPGSAYREALLEEIEAVVRSPEWAHYVEGQHWRELPFLHLLGPREWRLGAYDLFHPGREDDPARVPRIVDFKTHVIESEEVPDTAATYEIQAEVYREAAATILGRPVQVSLHFTHPNVAIDV
ncbi:MAG: PD-(D/E)XK nuclease family protein, partial [Gemmatimonadota bacterium]